MNAPMKAILGTAQDLAKWRPQVERANKASGGVMSFDQLAEGIETGRFFMFASESAFVVINPQQWDSGLHLFIVSAGGSQVGLEDLYPVVAIWGQLVGAKKIVAGCRVGFLRRVLKLGWKQTGIFIEREI